MNLIDFLPFVWSLLLDLASVALLAYAFYYRRHHNREMTVAISVINVTLFALSGALASFTITLGVGFALFAVISIIRLRSDTAGWIEMTYLLVSLSTGLILGLPGFDLIEKVKYASVLVLAMLVLDARRIVGRKVVHRINVTIDDTNIDSASLRERVESLLGRKVDAVTVKSVNAMPASMKLEVRYRENPND